MQAQFYKKKKHNLIKKAKKFSNSLRNFFFFFFQFPHPHSLSLVYYFLYSKMLLGVRLILVGIAHHYLDDNYIGCLQSSLELLYDKYGMKKHYNFECCSFFCVVLILTFSFPFFHFYCCFIALIIFCVVQVYCFDSQKACQVSQMQF